MDAQAHMKLVEQSDTLQAERKRFAAVLSPSDCCTYDCQQGRNCPARKQATFPLATGCSLKSPPIPAKQPEPQDKTANESGTLWLVVSCFAVAGAWILVQYAPHIFRSLK